MLYILIALMGASIGSFINVVSVRLNNGENFISTRSHCPNCGHILHFWDLIPLFSYLYLRGSCRYCHHKIGGRYYFIEVFVSLLFVLVALLKGPLDILGFFFCSFLVLIALMDIDSYEVDLRVLLLLLLFEIILSSQTLEERIFSMIIGFLFYGLIKSLGHFIWKEEAFGMGDVYFLTSLGIIFSPIQIIFVGLLSFVCGGVFCSIWYLFFSLKERSTKIPFTPFISTSAIITYLFSIQWIQ